MADWSAVKGHWYIVISLYWALLSLIQVSITLEDFPFLFQTSHPLQNYKLRLTVECHQAIHQSGRRRIVASNRHIKRIVATLGEIVCSGFVVQRCLVVIPYLMWVRPIHPCRFEVCDEWLRRWHPSERCFHLLPSPRYITYRNECNSKYCVKLVS